MVVLVELAVFQHLQAGQSFISLCEVKLQNMWNNEICEAYKLALTKATSCNIVCGYGDDGWK